MIYTLDTFPFDKLVFHKLEREAGQKDAHKEDTERKIRYYAQEVCAFDIETTRYTEINQSAMYIWQFAIEQDVIIGREWIEFKALLWKLKEKLNNLRLVIYVHNLSFDGHFLSGIYHFNDYEVFCTDSRKILKCSMYKCFEFRCSYRLLNMGLDEAAKKYNTEYKKITGFDYSKRRYSDTELTDEELAYTTHDVLALTELIHNVAKLYGDNLYSIPLTSTGFVRRDLKESMQSLRLHLADIAPHYECHKLLRAAFRGGNTHASRFFSGYIVEDVNSQDIESSYPAQQCNELFPMYKWEHLTYNIAEIEEGIQNNNAAFIMYVAITDIELKNKYVSVPYIPVAKCSHLRFPPKELNKGVCTDNGRILQAAYIEIPITDIDYKIIYNQYHWRNIIVLDVWRSHYAPLPDEWKKVNTTYFAAKTALKGVEEQELYYMKAKNKLNGIYGDSVQDPCKPSIKFADCMYLQEEIVGKEEEEEFYHKKMKAPYKLYQWGVWTTCRARERLQQAIDICDGTTGTELIYVDTDCVKYTGELDLSSINDIQIEKSKNSGLIGTDKKGVEHYGGVFTPDAHYKRFITLGAKKYAYEDDKGELHITISGVNKKKGAVELAAKGGLEAFLPGFVFTNSGKTESHYTDTNDGAKEIDGRIVDFVRNITINDVTYTLSVADDYARLLEATSLAIGVVKHNWIALQSAAEQAKKAARKQKKY